MDSRHRLTILLCEPEENVGAFKDVEASRVVIYNCWDATVGVDLEILWVLLLLLRKVEQVDIVAELCLCELGIGRTKLLESNARFVAVGS